jgi:hypothetical protein
VDRHREQGHRDAFAGGQQHVQLAARRERADLVRQVHQLVRSVAHGGHDHDHVVAGLAGGHDALGDPLDPFSRGDGGSAVLLHHQSHGRSLPPGRPNVPTPPVWAGGAEKVHPRVPAEPAPGDSRSHDPAPAGRPPPAADTTMIDAFVVGRNGVAA